MYLSSLTGSFEPLHTTHVGKCTKYKYTGEQITTKQTHRKSPPQLRNRTLPRTSDASFVLLPCLYPFFFLKVILLRLMRLEFAMITLYPKLQGPSLAWTSTEALQGGYSPGKYSYDHVLSFLNIMFLVILCKESVLAINI